MKRLTELSLGILLILLLVGGVFIAGCYNHATKPAHDDSRNHTADSGSW